MKSIIVRIVLFAAGVILGVAPIAQAQTIYTSDSNIVDFTSQVTSYATFSSFSSGDVSSPFTPTSSELAASGFRVYAGTFTNPGLPANNWILASFSSPVSSILVFSNIDHFGSAYDGYQYTIEGSNNLETWTPLFDAVTVPGEVEPFTLGLFTGTAPSIVNNVLTPGAGPDGTVGYEAQFNFGAAYRYYAIGASTEAINAGNADQELSAVGTSSVTVHLAPGATSTATAAFLTNGDPNDPASHAMSVTTNVTNPNGIDATVTAFYVPTELSTGMTGKGIADGICEVGSGTPTDNDIDCRLADGGFSYPAGSQILNGDKLVPHCAPLHSLMCVWYRITSTAVAQDQNPNTFDYIPPVVTRFGWNTNVNLATSNPEYQPGWNNQNERLYDRRGDDPDNSFKFDITDDFVVTCTIFCVLPADQGGTGHIHHFNDLIWADVPNPPSGTADTLEPLVPVPGISPYPYLKGLPMLVTFELEHGGGEKTDPTALTKPHSVNVATLDPNGLSIPIQFPPRFPTTVQYNPFLKVYYIFLSPAPYKTDGTVYTLQIGSDLISQPVSLNFVVKHF